MHTDIHHPGNNNNKKSWSQPPAPRRTPYLSLIFLQKKKKNTAFLSIAFLFVPRTYFSFLCTPPPCTRSDQSGQHFCKIQVRTLLSSFFSWFWKHLTMSYEHQVQVWDPAGREEVGVRGQGGLSAPPVPTSPWHSAATFPPH